MDTLTLLTSIVLAGYDMRVRSEKTVRNAQDVTLVIVNIGNEFQGEGLTPSEALQSAFMSMKVKVQARADKDKQLLRLFDPTAM
jgi:hypothetical protein